MLNTPRKMLITTISSMMLVLLFVVGTAVPAHAASNDLVGDTTKAGNSMNIALWIAVLVLVALVIILIMNLRKQIAEKKSERATAAERYRRLSNLQKATNRNLKVVEGECTELELWQNRAIKANPGIQALINKQINQELADQFVKDYLQTNTEGMETFKAYDILDKIFLNYNALAPEVKELVNCDMKALKESFDEVTSKYIEEAVMYLARVNSTTFGKVEELDTLYEALEYHEALPYAIKRAVPERVISNLSMKVASAEMHMPIEAPGDDDEE